MKVKFYEKPEIRLENFQKLDVILGSGSYTGWNSDKEDNEIGGEVTW